MTFRQLLQEAQSKLSNFPTPDLDTKVLLKKAFSLDETGLFLKLDEKITDKNALDTFNSLISERKKGIPIAYIIGQKEFYGRDYVVTPDVLIPRPETEFIIDYLKDSYPNLTKILEIGTGSGCIAISLNEELPNAEVTATDISAASLQVAKKNATMLTGEKTPHFLQSDLLEEVNKIEWDIIVANLPYLDQKKHTDDSILHEPDLALYASLGGLDLYQKLFRELEGRHFYFKLAIFEMLDYQAEELHKFIQENYPKWQSKILPHPGGIVSFLKLTSK